jgi:hypothetical protein
MGKMRCDTLKAEIQHRGYQYRMMRLGRGLSHEAAFAAGAQLILDLIKSGELSINQINQS